MLALCAHTWTHTRHALLTLCDIRTSSGPRFVSRPEAFCSSSPVLIHPHCSSPSPDCLQRDCMHQRAYTWCASLCVQRVCSPHCVSLCVLFASHLINACAAWRTRRNKTITCKGRFTVKKSKHSIRSCYVWVCLFLVPVTCLPLLHLSHPDSPGVLVTCSLLLFPVEAFIAEPAVQPRNGWFNSPHHAGPSITDPVVRDKVLSCRKGWQINLNPDWCAGMRVSGLVWGQHHEVEKPVSINRTRDLHAGDSGSSVMLRRVKLRLGQSRFSF